MKYGFALRRLALTGPGRPAAELTFTRGLNVIAGPSDTGKSFVLQCIDYALGGGDVPKEIPEAERYTTVILEIESNHDKRVYTFERSLRGADVRLSTQEQPIVSWQRSIRAAKRTRSRSSSSASPASEPRRSGRIRRARRAP